MQLFLSREGNGITADQAKDWLGWQEESENIKFGGDYLLTDRHEKKVRCHNNVTNRPLYRAIVDTLEHEIIHRHWNFNGEPIIIGKTGLILNGQHTLIALVLANQLWASAEGQFRHYWETAPTLDKLVVTGVDEDDRTVNTMDTCKPRSLADVIYRSEFFATMAEKDRKQVAKMTTYAIKTLWERTGALADAHNPRVMRTHALSLDFINRHPKILDCVKHIYEEDGTEGRISKFISPGAAAGLLYLMGCSSTDGESENQSGYLEVDHPSEKLVDWKLWEKATEFWVLVAGGHVSMAPVRKAIGAVKAMQGAGNFRYHAFNAVFALAWNAFADGKKITDSVLQLETKEDDEEGTVSLINVPTVGGIDVGRLALAESA